MGDNNKTDTLDAAQQVIVLAFDLADAEVDQLPTQVKDALTSPPVQKAIRKTLLDFAQSKSQSGGTVISDDEAKKLFSTLGSSITDAGSKELLEKIKKLPEYKKLEASVEAFKKAAESSSLGVWIDKNKKILYVVGAALAVGTAGTLYITKTGGPLLDKALNPLKGKQFEILQIGKLTIKAGLWDFQPDARILGAKVTGTLKWDRVTVEVKFGLLAQETQVQKAEGEASVKSGPVSLSVTGSAEPEKNKVNLAVKLGYDGVVGNGKLNIGIGALDEDKALKGTLGANYRTPSANFGLSGNIGPNPAGGSRPAYGAMFTVSIPIE